MRNHWLQQSWKLEIKKINPVAYECDTFVPRDIEISKGPYKTTISSCAMQDLRDCHGLSAEAEMVMCICQELSNHFRPIETETKRGVTTSWSRSWHKNMEITNEEKRRMAMIFHCMRYKKPFDHLLD